jgi:metal-sulfur cluster biosynthetic enzyme
MTATLYEFDAPEMLRAPVLAALRRVVDPEVAMNIVDVGLVYRVALVDGRELHVQVTMTSVACPVADVILEDIERELDRAVPSDLVIRVQLVWEPPWNPDRLSDEARRFMGR